MLRPIALSLACLATFATAQAEPTGRWGAVAFGAPDGAGGYAIDHPSADEARDAALAGCPGCTRTLVVFRACVAVAESPSGAVGTSMNRWRGRVIARALAICGNSGAPCEVTAVACTTH